MYPHRVHSPWFNSNNRVDIVVRSRRSELLESYDRPASAAQGTRVGGLWARELIQLDLDLEMALVGRHDGGDVAADSEMVSLARDLLEGLDLQSSTS
jgi:hypothetical protein